MEPSAILQELKETVDPAFLPRPFYRVAMLPRQETGKLARKMVLQLFESQRSRAQDDEELAETAS
jgi:acyl-coenzyme A synthetase/AMP-(fatty) acid ligase